MTPPRVPTAVKGMEPFGTNSTFWERLISSLWCKPLTWAPPIRAPRTLYGLNMGKQDIPYGYCHCGCGQKTRLSPYSWQRRGWVAGEPQKYKHGHGRKGKKTNNKANVKPKYFRTYRKIVSDYLGRPLERGEVIHHINGDRKDNHINNLELMLHAEHNRCHALKNCKRFENHHKAKLKNDDIPQVKYLLCIGKSVMSVSKMYGLSPKSIRDIRDGVTWKGVM